MNTQQEQIPARNRRARAGRIAEPVAWVLMAVGVVASAIVAKEAGTIPSLVSVNDLSHQAQPAEPEQVVLASRTENLELQPAPTPPDEIRWFDGRPVRPVRTMWMTVTAYSPGKASCGPFADGQTATLHSVMTNAMQLVAADPRVLAYGSMITVPEYADGDIVPVLDCGAAIKGNRLDVLYPTHRRARQWGVQQVPVTIWEYADGQPAPNPRKLR